MEAAGSKEGIATQDQECGMPAEFCSVVKIDSLWASAIVRHVTFYWRLNPSTAAPEARG